MRNCLFFIIICFLFGCASKQERTEKFLNENPLVFAQLCAINFPVTEKIVEGKTIIDTLTIEIPGKEIPCPEYIDQDGQLQKPKVKCPDAEIKHITKYKTDTIYRENTANIIRLKTENSKLVTEKQSLISENKELNNTLRKWRIIAAVLSLLFLSSIYIHFKR